MGHLLSTTELALIVVGLTNIVEELKDDVEGCIYSKQAAELRDRLSGSKVEIIEEDTVYE